MAEKKDKGTENKVKSPMVVDFGLRIRELMEDAEMKITQLAAKSDLETENLRKYLNGRQEPRVSIAKRIADALEIDPGELFKKPSEKFLKQYEVKKSLRKIK